MAATIIERHTSEDHICIFCIEDATVYVYSNGQEVIACPNCGDYKGIVSTGDDEIYDLEEEDE